MLEAEFLVFCAGRSEDENHNMSLHGIFDTIYAQNFPATHNPFKVVARFMAKKPLIKQIIRVRLVIERDNEEIGKQEFPLTVIVEKEHTMTLGMDLEQLVFDKPGKYFFKLYVDDKLLITRPLRVQSADVLTEK